jgi:hypothetical protein
LRAVYVSGQYGVILPANFLKEKEGMKLKVYNKYRIFHDLLFDMIYIQLVVCFLSPSLGDYMYIKSQTMGDPFYHMLAFHLVYNVADPG